MTIEQAGRKMPFNEKDGYVEQLVSRTTEQAIRQSARNKAHTVPLRFVAAIAASVQLLLGATLMWYNTQDEPQTLARTEQQDPLGNFLNSITDEEARQIEFYEIEEIYF